MLPLIITRSELVSVGGKGCHGMVSAFVLNCNIASPFAVKALACAQAMHLGLDLGLQLAVVEGYVLLVIKKCQSSETDESEMGAYIRDIQHYR
ncbi:hypothetical protein CXB51_003784 [Gossypium anomalum]|uniref:RNase H type-1 domain-containing protein n=1 Tax=Gossypium anomalum TaxID=47600 RepID=A0A8J6DBR5_9ROSI|nr:hypothetical protein CXB51_003784 [Gossypium anomalum]